VAASVVAVGVLVVPPTTTEAIASPADIRIEGSGWGHGRGMGQWGAYGYAVGRGWDHQRILDHFYGGTRLASDAGNPTVRVHLTARGSVPLVVTGRAFTVAGQASPSPAVRVRHAGSGLLAVERGPSCAGPWTPWRAAAGGDVAIRSTGNPATVSDHLQVCESTTTRRAYRGDLVAVNLGSAMATVNVVRLDDYLRGVVPREVPASWGNRPNGAAVLRAQAVAARSYALAGRWRPWAETCDTTSCQVYGGSAAFSGGSLTSLEDARTDAAVATTTGQVRRHGDGRVARTEFSASTGGRTVSGAFPSVPDEGDATAANPHRAWSVTMNGAEVGRRLGIGTVTHMEVVRRGAASAGDRVERVALHTGTGVVERTGEDVRWALGLKSTRFVVRSTRPAPSTDVVVRALYADVLGRAADAGGLRHWSSRPEAQAALGISSSEESARRDVDAVHRAMLGRSPSPAESADHVAALRRGVPRTQVVAEILASPQALAQAGGDPAAWVSSAYRAVLGRAADGSGLAHWVGVVGSAGHVAAARGIASSAEAGHLRLDQMYRSMLGRSADPAGQRTWVPQLQAGRDAQVLARIAGSGEYRARAAQRFPR
jgi:SpoIID/LytB domain protein